MVQYLGLDRLSSSVGFLQMAKGPAALVGPPLAGKRYCCLSSRSSKDPPCANIGFK